MKKLSKILLGAGIVASLAACDRKAEFTTSSFVAFDATSVEVAEDAGSLQIPVYAYAKNGDYAFPRSESASTSVTFEIVDGTAVNGTDFTVEPANGVLTFSGSSEGSITVTPINHAGVRTGDLSFTIRITGASDGFTLGGARELTVNIKDQDHPLASILGTYLAESVPDYAQGYYFDITTTVAPVDGTSDQVTLSNLFPYLASAGFTHTVVGVVSEDLTTITISSQFTVNVQGDDVYFVPVSNFDGETYYTADELVLNIDTNRHTLTAAPAGFAARVGEGPGLYELFWTDELTFTMQ